MLNRGEAAVRFLRALRDYNQERGTELSSVVFYTEPDRNAPFLRLADDIVSLGPALVPGPSGGLVSAYTEHEGVLAALAQSGCDAVWPGWGFVAEDADFVAALEARGITFIGPSSAAMRRLGDKIEAKRVAQASNVPMAPWHAVAPDEPLAETLAAAEAIGYPLIVKASAGGGGRGIRLVREPATLAGALEAVQAEATRSFRAGGLFLEACVTAARHIEVQLVVGVDGVGTALGIRDCTVQRRYQKLIEEAPSPLVNGGLGARLEAAAERLGEAVGYRGVGTVEFMVDPRRDFAHFLEVNTRLQVEHAVTEMVTGVDLVHVQIDIARGLPWQRPEGPPRGHAIEVRLNAENAERDFQPSPGLVRVFRPPLGPGIRVDSGVAEGVMVAPEFDSMIAKVIAHGRDRNQALARMRRALRELEISVEDGATNKAFLTELLVDPAVVEAEADTGWLDRRMAHTSGDGGAEGARVVPTSFEALCVAAILLRQRALDGAVADFASDVQHGIPYRLDPGQTPIALSLRGVAATFEAFWVGSSPTGTRWLVGPVSGGERSHTGLFEARLEVAGGSGPGAWLLYLSSDGTTARRHVVLASIGKAGVSVEVDGKSHLVEPATGGHVRAPAPALVVAIHVSPGDEVVAGERLCTLEAMKMEVPVLAPQAGRIAVVHHRPNEQVLTGEILFELESGEGAAAGDKTPSSVRENSRGEMDARREGRERGGVPEYAAQATDRPTPQTLAVAFSPHAASDGAGLAGLMPRGRMSPLALCFPEGRPDPAAVMHADEADREAAVRELARILRWALVGWEVPSGLLARAEALLAREEAYRGLSNASIYRPLADLLTAFWDIEQLFAPRLDVGAKNRPLAGKLAFFEACRLLATGVDPSALSGDIEHRLLRALAHHGVTSLSPGPRLMEALWRLAAAHVRREARHRLANLLLRALMALGDAGLDLGELRDFDAFLMHIGEAGGAELPALRDNARQARYLFFRRKRMRRVPTIPAIRLIDLPEVSDRARDGVLGEILRTTYGAGAELGPVRSGPPIECHGVLGGDGARALAVMFAAPLGVNSLFGMGPALVDFGVSGPFEVHIFVLGRCEGEELLPRMVPALERIVATTPAQTASGAAIHRPLRVAVTWTPDGEHKHHRSLQVAGDRLVPEPGLDDIHPARARRLELWRLSDFDLERLGGVAPNLSLHAWRARARVNPKDERIVVVAELQQLPRLRPGAHGDWEDDGGAEVEGGHLDQARRELDWILAESGRILREAQAGRGAAQRYFLNRIVIYVAQVIEAGARELTALARHIVAHTRDDGVHKVVLRARVKRDDEVVDRIFWFAVRGHQRIEVREDLPSSEPMRAASDYHLRVERAHRLGTVYPYETIRALQGGAGVELAFAIHPDMVHGHFEEHDLDASGTRLVPVDREPGKNTTGVVVGLITHVTRKHPEGMTRVWIGADATTAMGALAEPECRRILAALALARELGVPVEWLPISAGAKIAMDSGTENLDWTARVLAEIIEFTQDGGEINIIVAGVNVGAQSYWNAEATMLMHTRGVLIQTADGSMVLTGKRALEVSGSVSAEDERGIGGYERIMGPNGQAQYWAKDLSEAYRILMEHYVFSYVAPGEERPRWLRTRDPASRSILEQPAELSEGMVKIADLFSEETNPGRKKPFAIRDVMHAVIDQDGGWLERFADMAGGETAAVWDAHLGGHAVCLIGFESQNLPRRDKAPLDGPDRWTGGTLFPQSSKKVARAINQAAGNRPVVVLANLSGFDGSPESMRRLQLEYGAEIGRAVVNFPGPIVFVVIGRYHGGAYVVFSKALNPNLTAFAVEGSYASVIGGAPAAAVVFPRLVRARANKDPRVAEKLEALAALDPNAIDKRAAAMAALDAALADAVLEHQGRLAREFDAIHSVERAVEVGSLDAVIAPEHVRERIIQVLDRHAPPLEVGRFAKTQRVGDALNS